MASRHLALLNDQIHYRQIHIASDPQYAVHHVAWLLVIKKILIQGSGVTSGLGGRGDLRRSSFWS